MYLLLFTQNRRGKEGGRKEGRKDVEGYIYKKMARQLRRLLMRARVEAEPVDFSQALQTSCKLLHKNKRETGPGPHRSAALLRTN